MDEPDRAVKVLLAERKARVPRDFCALKVVAKREADVQIDNLSARSHDLAHKTPAYLEGVGDNLLADRGDSGGFCARIKD